jgi:hypothetical protein
MARIAYRLTDGLGDVLRWLYAEAGRCRSPAGTVLSEVRCEPGAVPQL